MSRRRRRNPENKRRRLVGHGGYHRRVIARADGVIAPACERCGRELQWFLKDYQLVCEVCWDRYPEEREPSGPMPRKKGISGKFTGKHFKLKGKTPFVPVPKPPTPPAERIRKTYPGEQLPLLDSPSRKRGGKISHAGCPHPPTPAGRRACRRNAAGQGRL